MSKFRSIFMLKVTAFLITILSCISAYSIEYKDIQGVREKEGNKAAFISLKQLAEQGNAQAQFELGVAYEHPIFDEPIKKDLNEAIKWYTKAALQGKAEAQYRLGVLYGKGHGTPKSYAQAFKWYKLAAEQGNSYAQCNLGVMYDRGEGTPKNYMQAFNWFKMAAEQGNVQAQFNLGIMYNDGLGIPKNYIEAYKWYSIAAASDSSSEDKVSDPARALMNILEFDLKMTPEQIATAQNLAKEWVDTH